MENTRKCAHDQIDWNGYSVITPTYSFHMGECRGCGAPVHEKNGRAYIPEIELYNLRDEDAAEEV